MKILVSNKFLDSIAGGSDNATYYLVKELSERGHEVDVFAYVNRRMDRK